MFGMKRRDFITLLGGAATWPLAALAQQGRLPIVGVLRPNPKDVIETFAEPFRRYMKATGWEEGRNIDSRLAWTESLSARAAALPGEPASQTVDLSLAFASLNIR